MRFLSKFHPKFLSLIVTGFVVLGLPLMVFVSSQKQDNRQHASAACVPTPATLTAYTPTTSCGTDLFRYVKFGCSNGYSGSLGSDTSCKSTAEWKNYAYEECTKQTVCVEPTPINYCPTVTASTIFGGKSCGTNLYDSVSYTCSDGYKGYFGGDTSCKTWETWIGYAQKDCASRTVCSYPTAMPTPISTTMPYPTSLPTTMPYPTTVMTPKPTLAMLTGTWMKATPYSAKITVKAGVYTPIKAFTIQNVSGKPSFWATASLSLDKPESSRFIIIDGASLFISTTGVPVNIKATSSATAGVYSGFVSIKNSYEQITLPVEVIVTK